MKDIVEVGNVHSTISSRYKTLTNSEKLVADVVIQSTPEVLEVSVIGLAEMAGVGEATVIRFCRKLGFKGFQGFKMILAAEMMQNNSRIQRENAENSSAQERLFHMQEAYRQAVDETVRMLDLEKVEEACAAILSCKKLLFFGVGASGLTALEAKFKLMRIGFNVDAATDGHMMAMQAALLESGGVAVGISYSGGAIDTVDALRAAKENGATTICFTHFYESEIMKYADICLMVGARELPTDCTALASKAAVLFVLDFLYGELTDRIKEAADSKQIRTIDVVRERFI